MAESVHSAQGQLLIPLITNQSCGAEGISAGMVVMPPCRSSKAHLHHHSEIIVICIEGCAATLVGPEMKPILHGPGEFIYIPEGMVHAAVNLSSENRLIAIEVRTDPQFNEDVVLAPELDAEVEKIAAELRNRFANGTLQFPVRWKEKNFGPFRFIE